MYIPLLVTHSLCNLLAVRSCRASIPSGLSGEKFILKSSASWMPKTRVRNDLRSASAPSYRSYTKMPVPATATAASPFHLRLPLGGAPASVVAKRTPDCGGIGRATRGTECAASRGREWIRGSDKPLRDRASIRAG